MRAELSVSEAQVGGWVVSQLTQFDGEGRKASYSYWLAPAMAGMAHALGGGKDRGGPGAGWLASNTEPGDKPGCE